MPTELPSGIGCAIVEQQLLEDLTTLWFGPLLPERLERIERALRAILTSTALVAARVSDPWFAAAFPERFDVLSVGLGLVPLVSGAVAGAAKQILESSKPTTRVSSVSLARKLVRDFRKDLANSRAVLARHLSEAELRDFGM